MFSDIRYYSMGTKARVIIMDIKKLKLSHPHLLEYLAERGYSKSYVDSVNKHLHLLFENEGKYSNYDDFYKKYFSGGKRERVTLKAIQGFDEYNHMPDGMIFSPLSRRVSSYILLNETFKAIIDAYKVHASSTDKRPATIVAEANNAATFLLSMQNLGCKCLNDITEQLAITFFYSNGVQIRGNSYATNIKAVFKTNAVLGQDGDCSRLYCLIPSIRKRKSNYAYMTKTEETLVKSELLNEESSKLTCRERAAGRILYYTGLRGCDIANMKLQDIDWKRERITLVQSKTGVPIVLPLRPVVGNAILDYIREERNNNCESDFLFNSMTQPEHGIKARSIGQFVSRMLEKIGFRNERKGYGVRVFRHHLASTLLNNEQPLRIISEVLGHMSAESVNAYIDADIEHLRQCGLDISNFPVNEEVLL